MSLLQCGYPLGVESKARGIASRGGGQRVGASWTQVLILVIGLGTLPLAQACTISELWLVQPTELPRQGLAECVAEV